MLARCRWRGVAALTAAIEDGMGANSDPSVSLTNPSVVNVASPGISKAGGVAVGGSVAVNVNWHDPRRRGRKRLPTVDGEGSYRPTDGRRHEIVQWLPWTTCMVSPASANTASSGVSCSITPSNS